MGKQDVTLERFNEEFLKDIWNQGFREERPQWKEWDGPYFDDDYHSSEKYIDFLTSTANFFLRGDSCKCIVVDGKAVGTVTRYWKDRKTLWLEIGITIYDPVYWSGGIGTRALKLWIDEIFDEFPELEHIGLVTWSGNMRMMKAAQKSGMQKEAQIRKVRFWKNQYYDSVMYGILRSENK